MKTKQDPIERKNLGTRVVPLFCGLALLALMLSAQPRSEAQTFTQIVVGPVVNDTEGTYSVGCAWGDYDNDGFIDLFVANIGQNTTGGGAKNYLYRNNRDGTFTRITQGKIANDIGSSNGCAWGDYDNDGFLDLFVANDFGEANFLYRNNGDGTFTKITQGRIVTDTGDNEGCAWGDFNNDGFVDLFVSTKGGTDFFYKNNGDGTFARITTAGSPVRSGADSYGCSWGDFNNDGKLDLFVSAYQSKGVLYRNNGDGSFIKVPNGDIDSVNAVGCAWGDYDNDGNLDLFVAAPGKSNSLYHNNGNGTFTKITEGDIVNDSGQSTSCAWGDFNNDGYIDLVVVNAPGGSFLYQNNGDGTFTRVLEGPIVEDGGVHQGCAWGDFNNDGFLDLFVSKQGINTLFRNDAGNGNNWLLVKCAGAKSNKAGIGAKIRVKATIAGKTFWQMREISGGGNYDSQNDLRAHFGLGDAKKIDTLHIEWPSGVLQEIHDVAAKQILTVTEPAAMQPLILGSPKRLADGKMQFTLTGNLGTSFTIEASIDLTRWTALGTLTVTNADHTASFSDASAASFGLRFYRALQR